MTIKEFAYLAQQELKNQTDNDFKRSHIYELLAASFGYNSFAALCVESIVTQRQKETKCVSQNNPALHQRCIELGYKPVIADVISIKLSILIKEHRIVVVNLSALITRLHSNLDEKRHDGKYYDENRHNDKYYDEYDDEDEDELQLLYELQLLPELEVIASKGNALAHYALALIHTPDYVGVHYWYNQEKQGRVLTGVEKDWHDDFTTEIAKYEKFEFHLREASRLGKEDALFDLADKCNDPSFFEKVKNADNYDPLRVADIAANMGRTEDARHWLTIAAEGGDIYAMRRLIEEFDNKNHRQSCWTWIYLSQMLEDDLTKDNYYAIHENGSSYDDDVGGPLYVAGEGGVRIAPLNKDQDKAAKIAAQKLFENLDS